MLAAAADATATPAPGRLHWFTNGFSRRPFRYPAHAAGVAGYRMVFVPSNRCWLADGFRRGVRRGKDGGLLTRRFAPRGGERSLSLAVAFLISARWPSARTVTEPTLVLVPRTKYRHGSAAPLAGLVTLRPLHSLPHPLHRLRGTLPLISTAANCRDRQRQRCPKDSRGRDAPHIGQDRQYGARLRLSPKAKGLAPRGCARCKASAVSVRSVISAPPPFRRLHCGGQKQPNSLRKPNWSDTPALDFAACCLGCPITVSRPSFRSVPSPGSQNRWLRAGATVPGNEVTRRIVETAPLTGLA